MRHTLLSTILTCALGAPLLAPATVFAQDPGGCSCVAAYSGGQAGVLEAANGDVLVSQPAGFAPGAAGSAISVGSRIMVGQNASAVIQVGSSCRLNLPAGTDVSISAEAGKLCVRVIDPITTAQTQSQNNNGGFGLPETIFGGIVLGAGVGAAFGDDDGDPVSN